MTLIEKGTQAMECKYVGVRLRYILAGCVAVWVGACYGAAKLAQVVTL